jgi:hypothetical protein
MSRTDKLLASTDALTFLPLSAEAVKRLGVAVLSSSVPVNSLTIHLEDLAAAAFLDEWLVKANNLEHLCLINGSAITYPPSLRVLELVACPYKLGYGIAPSPHYQIKHYDCILDCILETSVGNTESNDQRFNEPRSDRIVIERGLRTGTWARSACTIDCSGLQLTDVFVSIFVSLLDQLPGLRELLLSGNLIRTRAANTLVRACKDRNFTRIDLSMNQAAGTCKDLVLCGCPDKLGCLALDYANICLVGDAYSPDDQTLKQIRRALKGDHVTVLIGRHVRRTRGTCACDGFAAQCTFCPCNGCVDSKSPITEYCKKCNVYAECSFLNCAMPRGSQTTRFCNEHRERKAKKH